VQYKYVPILIVVLILIPDFLNSYAMQRSQLKLQADQIRWQRKLSPAHHNCQRDNRPTLPKGQWDSLTAQQGEELFGWQDGLTGGGRGWAGKEEKGLDGSTGRWGEEGVGWINGLIGGRGVWTDWWFNGSKPRLAGQLNGNGLMAKAWWFDGSIAWHQKDRQWTNPIIWRDNQPKKNEAKAWWEVERGCRATWQPTKWRKTRRWRLANATINRKFEGLDGEEGVGWLNSLIGGGGDWAAQWLDRRRRGLGGLMAWRGEEWVSQDRGRRGLALNRKNGYLPVDTAGEGHEEGQHGNMTLYCGLTKLNNNFIFCNFIAPFTPPLCSLMHTVEAMIGAIPTFHAQHDEQHLGFVVLQVPHLGHCHDVDEPAAGPDVGTNCIIVDGFSMEW
jgi:hypothetical protein